MTLSARPRGSNLIALIEETLILYLVQRRHRFSKVEAAPPSIFLNPGKTRVLPVLPPRAPLLRLIQFSQSSFNIRNFTCNFLLSNIHVGPSKREGRI